MKNQHVDGVDIENSAFAPSQPPPPRPPLSMAKAWMWNISARNGNMRNRTMHSNSLTQSFAQNQNHPLRSTNNGNVRIRESWQAQAWLRWSLSTAPRPGAGTGRDAEEVRGRAGRPHAAGDGMPSVSKGAKCGESPDLRM